MIPQNLTAWKSQHDLTGLNLEWPILKLDVIYYITQPENPKNYNFLWYVRQKNIIWYYYSDIISLSRYLIQLIRRIGTIRPEHTGTNRIIPGHLRSIWKQLSSLGFLRSEIHWRNIPRTSHSFTQLSLWIIFSIFHQRWIHIYIGPNLSINESGLALLMNWVVHYPSRFSGRCWWTGWTPSTGQTVLRFCSNWSKKSKLL